MEKTLSIIPENPYLVFIALNPTEEALNNKAVFSRDNAYWNLLEKAGILEMSILKVDLKDRAKEAFFEQKHSKKKLGFADLLPQVSETDSNKVKIPKDAVNDLLKTTPHLKDTEKIALMGQKVVDAFARNFKGIKKWKNIPVIDGKRQFGCIGSINFDGSEIELFAMPFPVNNNVKNKHEYYASLIK
jgi:hypothetical protein